MMIAVNLLLKLSIFALHYTSPKAYLVRALTATHLSQSHRLHSSRSFGRLQAEYFEPKAEISKAKKLAATLLIAAVIASSGGTALADEIGRETEAPTLFTGETVEICTKRGPLGACLKTESRTEENDNDKAKKYFRDPAELVRQKEAVLRGSNDADGNPLINKLKQQSVDNQEKNDLYVRRKTFENNQSATFGPFDRQVVIMNTDGRTFTLLQSPQAMRLKKAGFIKDREFIRQPTREDIDAALEPEGPGLADALLGVFTSKSEE